MRQFLSSFNFFILFIIIITNASFLLTTAYTDSAIFDESAHIVSGYNNIKNLDYRFNPEHPPLIKMMAGFPLLFQNLNFSKDEGYWTGINEQWWAGGSLMYEQNNNADNIVFASRMGPVLTTIILLLFTYFFAQNLIGRWWALVPTIMMSFSPLVLAHGHYVTTDTGAALGILVAIYFFLKNLFQPNHKNLIYAGLAFGFAQAVKFSALLLLPFMAIVVTIYTLLLFVNKRQAAETKPTIKHFSKDIFNQVVSVILIMIIGYFAIIYPLYLYTTWNYPMEKQVLDATALLNTFRVRELVNLDIWMSGNKLLRPFGQYLLGVMMVTQRTAGGNNAYFLGELSSQGWWYYFPLVYLMKETLPALILIFSGCLISLFNIFKTLKGGLRNTSYKLLEYLNTYFTEFALFIFIAIYWSSSISSPLNIGARHIIPTIPMFYILSTGAIKRWFAIKLYTIPTTPWERYENFIHNIFNIWIKSFVLTILIIWLIVGTFITYPYFLSYFNEFSGGKYNGHQYITDSNFDWGQDLKRLKKWTDIHLESDEKIAIDYFGGGSPKYYLGYQAEPWWSSRGNPLDEGIEWLAVSVNSIQGAALATPVNGFYRNPADEYRWLQNPANPTDRAGTSIFLYRLSESTINIPKEDSSEKNLN